MPAEGVVCSFVGVQWEQAAKQMASSLPESRGTSPPSVHTVSQWLPAATAGLTYSQRRTLTTQVLKCLPMGVYTSMVNTRDPHAHTRRHARTHTPGLTCSVGMVIDCFANYIYISDLISLLKSAYKRNVAKIDFQGSHMMLVMQ